MVFSSVHLPLFLWVKPHTEPPARSSILSLVPIELIPLDG